jgi:cytochrome oxidase Cu insertion factor (SCO1/SenC/PrrC family)
MVSMGRTSSAGSAVTAAVFRAVLARLGLAAGGAAARAAACEGGAAAYRAAWPLPPGRGKRGVRLRSLLAAAAAVTAGMLALAGCGSGAPAGGGSAGASVSGPGAASMPGGNPDLDPGTSLGGKPAPDFRLVNQFGQPMALSQFRGKVVLLGFEDALCTTVCPLTTQEMLRAKQLLGAAGSKVQLLGIDANPGAHAVSDVMAYSRAHSMVNQWDFLTGSRAQLAKVWTDYHIYAQIVQGQVDHTPALFVIDQKGREQRLYLTSMAYSSIAQQAQVLAKEISRLLPGHPALRRHVPLASASGQGPQQTVTMPSATSSGGTVTLAAGRPHLVVFFATWLTETSDLKGELAGLNSYARAAQKGHLPQLTAVDEEVTEPSPGTVRGYLAKLGAPLAYPVGMDVTGRVAGGYGAQDQPWYALTSASGKITWSHDGWLSLPALEQAVKQHAASGR